MTQHPSPPRPRRSFLFAPANHARHAAKAFECGADAVILDLEDAVALSGKTAARADAVAALQRPRQCLGYVRINNLGTEFCFEDLCSVVGPWLDGIVLPKVNGADDLRVADWCLAALERRHGLAAGRIDLLPIIETAQGIMQAGQIAAALTRVRRLAFGAGDYALDLGLTWDREEGEFAHARAIMVAASRAGGLEAPLDSVFFSLGDDEGLRASARRAQRSGFQGKMGIHPAQIPIINREFTPSASELEQARKIVAAFAAAEAKGSASIVVDGAFVDYPIYDKARRSLAIAATVAAADLARKA